MANSGFEYEGSREYKGYYAREDSIDMDHNVGPDGERIFGEANIWDIADEVTAKPSLWTTSGMSDYQKEMLKQYIDDIYVPQGQHLRITGDHNSRRTATVEATQPAQRINTEKRKRNASTQNSVTGLGQQTLRF